MSCTVVIPVYKSVPEKNEQISLRQCIKILCRHPVCILTYKELDITYYTKALNIADVAYSVQYFDKFYFDSIEGYNQLLMLKAFYQRFACSEYILIYQLDAYVFKDELNFWCQKGYDYIGALWFVKHGSHEKGDELTIAGNGGFSLRRIEAFLSVFNNRKPMRNLAQLEQLHPPAAGFVNKARRKIIIYTKAFFGIQNNIQLFMTEWKRNEDQFWANCFNQVQPHLRIPGNDEAIGFAFEKSAQFLYEQNGRQLPFGCHGWEKYEYETFWKNYIPTPET